MSAVQTQAANAVTPAQDGDSLKTPSWTSIVEAYHREGQNDREMLLALLNAKAKEDERLAALDNMRAEQYRAYIAHVNAFSAPRPATYAVSNASTSSSARPSLSMSAPSSPELERPTTPSDDARSVSSNKSQKRKRMEHDDLEHLARSAPLATRIPAQPVQRRRQFGVPHSLPPIASFDPLPPPHSAPLPSKGLRSILSSDIGLARTHTRTSDVRGSPASDDD